MNVGKLDKIGKIGIVGPGLIGGSIGLALKAADFRGKIIGVGHRQISIDKAINFGAIDEGAIELEALKGCKLVIIATPISLIKSTINKLVDILNPGSVVTDVGSTKRQICRWARKLINRNIEFVGSHPIAGSEKRGIDFARHDLFVNANCFITPTKSNTRSSIKLISSLWETVGMKVFFLSPAEHDKLLAVISHLPHIVAAGLVNACSWHQLEFTGTGFLDTTRIASGDVKLWADIILSNPDYIVQALQRFSGKIDEITGAIECRDENKLIMLLEQAKSKRDKLVEFKYQHRQIEA